MTDGFQPAADAREASHVDRAARTIRARWPTAPRVGLILGTGMSHLADHVQSAVEIPYEDVPHFPRCTALSHRGRLLCGRLAGAPAIVMDGRFHLYEGYSTAEITLPVRVMSQLGVETLIVGNAAGGVNPQLTTGDIVLVDSHINLAFRVAGEASPIANGRCRRVSNSPYDPRLIEQAFAVARRKNFVAHRGVYVWMTGPNYETRAEYRFLRRIGGDVVGMSTVPEAIVAAQCGLHVLALSVVTNVARPDILAPTAADDVVSAAATAEPKLRAIVLDIVSRQ